MVKVRHLKPTDYQVSDWSGGKTRQLCLFPPQGQYGTRDFDYRLSTATVELPESNFSDLSGFHRILMTLDHPIRLCHRDSQKEVSLEAFTPYYFEGRDMITSHGTCRDFNLIYSDHYQGQMQALTAEQDSCPRADIQFIYALSDLAVALDEGPPRLLKADELLIVDQETQATELQIMLSNKQPAGFPLAVWAGLNRIPAK